MKCGRRRLSFNYVKQYFEEQGCKLLETSWHGSEYKMKYIDTCGHNVLADWSAFRIGHRCPKCAIKRQVVDKKLVENYFKEHNCEVIEYKNATTPIKYKCECGNISQVDWYAFKKGTRCLKCKIKNMSGSKCRFWNPNREMVKLNRIIHHKSSNFIHQLLQNLGKRKTQKKFNILGYTNKQLVARLTSHPEWEQLKNKNWHLDHVFPINAFLNFGITDISLISSLENLRPLDATENIKKYDDYEPEDFLLWLKLKGIEVNETNDKNINPTKKEQNQCTLYPIQADTTQNNQTN
jgi:hypothetical protein